ncbi:MAG: PQQ-like beta-propeller repeat protein [Planctomycetes bacterium]|nr:PQQ-like beta-propeller repeat protein [Planctomycetota bacterium]
MKSRGLQWILVFAGVLLLTLPPSGCSPKARIRDREGSEAAPPETGDGPAAQNTAAAAPAGAEKSGSPSAGRPIASKEAGSLGIPEASLNAHGLLTINRTLRPDGPVKAAFVVGDDIFTVKSLLSSQPAAASKPGSPKYLLIAYDRKDLTQRWVYPLEVPLNHAPTVYRYPRITAAAGEAPKPEELYVVQKDEVHCLDLRYGVALWKSNLDFPVSSGAVASDTHYYVGSYDQKIYGILKNRTNPDWFYITRGDIRGAGIVSEMQTYFTSTDGRVYRFHGSRGARDQSFWQFATSAPITSPPVLFSRWVYAGSTDFKLYSLLERDGTKNWEFQAQAPIYDQPYAFNLKPNFSLVLCIGDDQRPAVKKRKLWALDAATGDVKWAFDHLQQTLAVGKDSIYFLTDPRSNKGRSVIALDGVTGKEKFSFPVDDSFFIPTTIGAGEARKQSGILYLIHASGFIQAIGERL